MIIQQTTGPAKLAVDLNFVKAHLNIDDDDTANDGILMTYLRAAIDQCEKHTGRALITQTWTLFLDAWPASRDEQLWEGVREGPDLAVVARAVALPKSPLRSVTHVKTYNDDDDATTWAAANYFVDTASEPGRLVARTGATFPSPTRAANGIEVEFVAGYGANPGDVPEGIALGVLQTVAHWQENRETVVAGVSVAKVPNTARALWAPYRIIAL